MGTYTGAEVALVGQWIEDRFAEKAAELESISVGLSGRVYEDIAPPDAPYPFIVYQCQVPPRDIRGVGVTRVMVDTLYVVKAVAQTNSYATLAPVASVIDSAMTSEAGSAVGDGLVLAAVREEQFQMIDVDSGTQFRHLGGEYKIHAQADQ